jgi:hypothetical protein
MKEMDIHREMRKKCINYEVCEMTKYGKKEGPRIRRCRPWIWQYITTALSFFFFFFHVLLPLNSNLTLRGDHA